MAERVCLGAVTGAHGVRGLVKVKPFTENPDDVAAYGPVEDERGSRRFTLAVAGHHKETVIVRVEGIADRDAAEALRGTRLYVDRSALPEPEDGEFYHADLIGLRVVTVGGEELGRVTALYDFGAGDLVEFAGADGKSRMLPFTEAAVPEVDIAGGRIVVQPPEGLLE
ncbi:ribosome maturation factor RimM [Thalassobaculum fulvum]|uniref:Ribosome maturation factor RimM n=1 Tax=Thalassobaculum fulvum TaxID=1633335 RepID=A0A918XN39_9PROT|nr:ribosome maturation factor RimM [Thalassobaculum fulvum]GHD40148.1 ribosome maturation factor RimM [Thalassobaculum fulvum]